MYNDFLFILVYVLQHYNIVIHILLHGYSIYKTCGIKMSIGKSIYTEKKVQNLSWAGPYLCLKFAY